MWFTRGESEARIAATMRTAIIASITELPLSWFLAIADNTDEAKFLYDRHITAVASGRRK